MCSEVLGSINELTASHKETLTSMNQDPPLIESSQVSSISNSEQMNNLNNDNNNLHNFITQLKNEIDKLKITSKYNKKLLMETILSIYHAGQLETKKYKLLLLDSWSLCTSRLQVQNTSISVPT